MLASGVISDTSISNSTSNNIQNGEASPWLYMSVKSDDYTFDLNDVTLTFYYGSFFIDPEFHRENSTDVPYFDLYLKNDEGNEIHYKHVDENLISYEYRSEGVYDENYKTIGYRHTHSEQITIPRELFTKEQGTVSFAIYGYMIKRDKYYMLNQIIFDYVVKDNKVTLSVNNQPWIREAID